MLDHSKLKKNSLIAKATAEMYEGMKQVSSEQAALEEVVHAQQRVALKSAMEISKIRSEWWKKAAELYGLDLNVHRYIYNEVTGEIRYDGLLADD